MPVERSDFNDGDILAKTTQVPCKGGHQFKYVYDDGHPITSECINPEQKRAALHIWIDVVKNTAVARAQEARDEGLARARRQKADMLRENPEERAKAEAMGLIVPAGTRTEETPDFDSPDAVASTPTARQRQTSIAAQPAESVRAQGSNSSDPVAMAKAQLVAATLDVQELSPKLEDAARRVKQWQAVLQALQGVELPKESAVIEQGKDFLSLLERR